MKFLSALSSTLLLAVLAGAAPAQAINYSDYDRVTRQYIDSRGLVDYRGLKADIGPLKSFIDQISAVSPDSHPRYFKDGGEQLRYWMTAYNAWVLYIAATEYPARNSLWNLLGLFRNRDIRLGGRALTLEDLEHGIIRKRFREPRIHFYINCAATSCPPLWQGAIPEGRTWDALNQSAKRFINDERNVKFDAAARKLYLSKIFDWFAEDFLGYLRDQKGEKNPHLSQFILMYLDGPQRDALANTPPDRITLKYFSYDKSLNEQK